MFHKIKSVTPLENYRLLVHFTEGCCREYDMAPLIQRMPIFAPCGMSLGCSARYTQTPAATVFPGMMTLTWMVPSFGKTAFRCPLHLTAFCLFPMPQTFGI